MTVLGTAGVAAADNIQDSIAASGSVALVAGSSSGGTATIRVVGNNADGTVTDPQCNWDTGESPLVLEIVTPAGVTASPDPLRITECGVDHTVTFTAGASAVSGTATVDITSTPAGGGGYNNQVSIPITVTQPAPTNTPPVVAVTGVTDGASYGVGSVPPAGCSVTDAEDGPATFDADLSTDGLDADGLGEQTASCSHEDDGGLTASSSVTYSIIDTSAPVVTYTLDPAAPDGLLGWWTGDVALTWHVSDPESPGSLAVLSGCVDRTIDADQLASAYSCSVQSSGGTTAVDTDPVKRDGNGPSVYYTDAEGTTGSNGWYVSPVTATFTATDAFSGPGDQTGTASSTSDGESVTIDSPAFTDAAGNTTAAGAATSPAFKIDTVAPAVGDAALSGTTGTNGWYTSTVSAGFTATDATSGVAGTNPRSVSTDGAQGTTTLLSPAFSDVAGNTTPAGAKSATVKVDSVAPSVNLAGGPTSGDSYFFGSVPAAPTCVASDETSGLSGTCTVSGYGTSAGTHTVTATATDRAGNTATATATYTVKHWVTGGFYKPVDMFGVVNKVKGGSTVPLKFELFADNEITDTAAKKSFTVALSTKCATANVVDAVEFLTTGGTEFRYDWTAGQFVQNWKVPTGKGCYEVTMEAVDGSKISALFEATR